MLPFLSRAEFLVNQNNFVYLRRNKAFTGRELQHDTSCSLMVFSLSHCLVSYIKTSQNVFIIFLISYVHGHSRNKHEIQDSHFHFVLFLIPSKSPSFHGRFFLIHIGGDQVGHKHCIPVLSHLRIIDVYVRGQRKKHSFQWTGISGVNILGFLSCPCSGRCMHALNKELERLAASVSQTCFTLVWDGNE